MITYLRDNIYTDNRNPECRLLKNDNHYKVISNEESLIGTKLGTNLLVLYNDKLRTYNVINSENTLWDPVSLQTFKKMMDYEYIYAKANTNAPHALSCYHFLPIPNPKLVDQNIINFLNNLWEFKQKNLGLNFNLNLPKSIYNHFFLKETDNQKKPPGSNEQFKLIIKLAKASMRTKYKLKFKWPFKPNSQLENLNGEEFAKMLLEANLTNKEKIEHITKVSDAYFSYQFSPKLIINRCILLNVQTDKIHKAFKKLLPILKQDRIVDSIEVGGPTVAARELANIKIYIYHDYEENHFRKLYQKIITLNIPTINLLPELINKEDGKGIGYFNVPDKLLGRPISFDQKIVVLSTMTLEKATNITENLYLGLSHFEAAGFFLSQFRDESCYSDFVIKRDIELQMEDKLKWLTEKQ